MKNGKYNLFIMVIALLLLIAGCSSQTSNSTEESNNNDNEETTEQVSGGEMRVALSAQPTTLDQHMDVNIYTRDLGRLVFETLVTTNANYQAVPMLAESVDVSEDSKVYTFHLRQGVKFHNGNEMTSEDVVASMERWVDKSSLTGSIFEGATFVADDDYTVTLTLANSSALVLDTMASAKQAAAIMPKEIIEAAPPEGVSEYIGTGPFKFEEWKQDQYIHFTKFEDYQAAEASADGLSGKKEVLVDEIYFDIVTDPSTRLAGLQTGEYDIAYHISYNDYGQLENSGNMNPFLDVHGELTYTYNKLEGIASNPKFRQAINAALNVEEIMLAGFTNENIFQLSSGYMNANISDWASDAGSEYYNQNDPEKAKALLEEIGYNGEEFRIMTSRAADYVYNAAVVISEQLKNIGVNVKLDVTDTTTLLQNRNKPETWDSYVLGSSIVSTPTQLVALTQGVDDEKTIELLSKIEHSTSLEEARQVWEDLQQYSWEEYMPITNLGSFTTLYGTTDKVDGFITFLGPVFWNTSVEQ